MLQKLWQLLKTVQDIEERCSHRAFLISSEILNLDI